MKKCIECEFSFKGERFLECRRYPPQWVTDKDFFSESDFPMSTDMQFPYVEEDEWCGEFSLREALTR